MWTRIKFAGIPLDYYINPFGEIINKKGKILKQRLNNRDYPIIDLYLAKRVKRTFTVHELVAKTFIPNPNNLPTVNHIDGIKTHNYINNLEWATYSDNNKHAYDTGLHKSLKGEESPFAKHSEEIVHKICKMLEIEPSPKKVAEEIGVSLSLVRSIKSKESWTSVSSEYNIMPTRFFMPEEIREKIVRWYYENKTIKEICSMLQWKNDSVARKRIRRVTDKYCVQRLS